MNNKDVRQILKKLNIFPTKRLGQNFLVDNSTRNLIINQANILKNDIILEIGPGLGALTEKLIEKAKIVYAIEIDFKLSKFLINRFSHCNNIEIINDNILDIEIPYHNKVVSNLPYTITGPVFEKIFFREKPPQGILTIEKSIADRIFFQKNYKNLSRITISVNTFMNPIKKFNIPRKSFYPTPNIDLNLIVLSPNATIDKFLIENDKRLFYLNFIGGIMPYKNKNLINALEFYIKNKLKIIFNKIEVINILNQYNIKNHKVNSFKIDDFLKICKILYEKLRFNEDVNKN